jgi:hypothetical protein
VTKTIDEWIEKIFLSNCDIQRFKYDIDNVGYSEFTKRRLVREQELNKHYKKQLKEALNNDQSI